MNKNIYIHTHLLLLKLLTAEYQQHHMWWHGLVEKQWSQSM